MPKLNIDGEEIEFEDGITLIQACEIAGREIPRFCYHERLSIAGNCRMCLVEVVGMPKPMASCATSVNDLRPGPNGEAPLVRTNSALVKKAREGVMEFLLINHPLDCPICDQGGECDLQDQAMAYGEDSNRYEENKRAVENKYIGPLIKTIMTRCIHCTRCVRFMTEIAGIEELGATGRGEDMEITTYLEAGLSSELSGNVIDLCPVGALTSRPYAFQARPWELRKTESIDVMDAMGANIRVDCRGREVMRIMPRNNDEVNEEWISDKSRFIWDGLRTQRLDKPYIKRDGRLVPASFDEAFALIAEKVQNTQGDRMAALIGDLQSAEEVFALKDLMTRLGVGNIDCRQDGAQIDPALGRETYIFNSTIEGVDEADALLLVGTNPRFEASVLNARIRRRWCDSDLKIGLIGEAHDLTYDYDYLGAGPETLGEIASGSGAFAETLKNAKRPMIIIGQSALTRSDGAAVLATAAKLVQNLGLIDKEAGWNGFNVLQNAAGRIGALDLGFVPGAGGRDTAAILDGARSGDIEVLYLLGADELDLHGTDGAFIIYQGSHGDRGAHHADVILPGAAYTEKNGTYVNIEGRVQMTEKAAFPPGDAREDWTIIRALSDILGQKLPYDSAEDLRRAMYLAAPQLARLNGVPEFSGAGITQLAGAAGAMNNQPFGVCIEDFYLTNPIARASTVMAELSALKAAKAEELTGTNG